MKGHVGMSELHACVWCVCYDGGVNKGFNLHLGLGRSFEHS